MNKTVYPVPCIHDKIALHRTTFAETKPICLRVPGSKSITNRAMLLAVLADGVTDLSGVLFSDDSRHFLQCVKDLGFRVEVNENAGQIRIFGQGGRIPASKASLYVGSAGTAARFLTALLGSAQGTYLLDASPQMRRRPMAPLLSSLKDMGAQIRCEEKEGFFPFTITGHGFGRHHLSVNIDQSSQFLSALLIAAARSPEDILIDTTGRHGMAYITMTIRMMEQFGVQVNVRSEQPDFSRKSHPDMRPRPAVAEQSSFLIPGGQTYRAHPYPVEPDVSAASYFYAMAALLGVDILVEDVHLTSMQGDIQFLHILEQLGCQLTDTDQGILLAGPAGGIYPGIAVDMSSCSDQAITLAALAPFAQTPTRITGIGHIRGQECDRLSAMASELTRMGIRCEEGPDSITIWPGTPTPAVVETYEDHRMAMGFSLVGLRSPGIVISNPDCCRKTFENYFQVLDQTIRRLISR